MPVSCPTILMMAFFRVNSLLELMLIVTSPLSVRLIALPIKSVTRGKQPDGFLITP